ncbi:MAG: hypothetical protein H8Z69_03250 [Nanohaloarchaea archaeon]|nr:hypothetical protein [Candidatus Nanohaloarchaea archaeon]
MLPSSENNVEEAWNYLENRFGVDRERMQEFRIVPNSGDYWLTSKQMETDLEVETYGFRLLRTTGRGLKPTTYALQFLDGRIEKNIVELDRDELLKLLKREEMISREMSEEGYVALEYDGRVVGCGFYKGEKVSSRVPKGRGNELAGVLED